MNYLLLSDNAARQFIDSSTVFGEYRRVREAARQYKGGMYWKKQNEYCYLVKTKPDNQQTRIGPCSAETEAIYNEFVTRKAEIEARLSSLRNALGEAEWLNKAQFMTTMKRLNTSVLSILQKVDPTFRRKEEQLSTAINDKGFEIDFLRRIPQGDDPHPLRLTPDDGDLWPVQARRANILTDARRFEHIVVSTTGRMAVMRTIDPQVFVEFKTWLGTAAPDRPAIKRRRDAQQAVIVKSLIDEGLLIA